MAQQVPLSSSAQAEKPTFDAARDDGTNEVVPDLAYMRLSIVNVAFIGMPSTGANWVLVDAGFPGTTSQLLGAVEKRFGGAPPLCIVLTHGHFDHVGCLEELANRWQVPIYAHELEHPYLDGSSSYPPPDPKVGGGLMSALAGLYPTAPINVNRWLHKLPTDGTIPELPEWRWIHTPGHTPGHVSLFRPVEKTLLAGDAFITTTQESAFAVLLQTTEMHGPPMYYTMDWVSARDSVRKLARLDPEFVITGHGRAMRGAEMRDALNTLARDFDRVAVPKQGTYVTEPARAEDGTAYR